MEQVHLIISGRVQGVFFRTFVKEKAQSLGLHGWVRNNKDGTVEVLAQGDLHALHALTQACHRGPDGARVDDVKAEFGKAREKIDGFEIKEISYS